jgi:hypothetical protein
VEKLNDASPIQGLGNKELFSLLAGKTLIPVVFVKTIELFPESLTFLICFLVGNPDTVYGCSADFGLETYCNILGKSECRKTKNNCDGD